MIQFFIGILLGALIGYGAYRAGALTRSGAWAAALTGGLIFGLGGLPWAVLLLTFFISSSVLSRTFVKRQITPGLWTGVGEWRVGLAAGNIIGAAV